MKKIIVAQGQIALTEKNGNFQHLLLAGEHRINDWFNKLTVSLFTLNHEPMMQSWLIICANITLIGWKRIV